MYSLQVSPSRHFFILYHLTETILKESRCFFQKLVFHRWCLVSSRPYLSVSYTSRPWLVMLLTSFHSHDDHFQVYKARCTKLGIHMHPHAVPKRQRNSLFVVHILLLILRSDWYSESQGTLDSIVTKQPRAPPFSSAGLMDYLVELVVSEDDVRVPLILKRTYGTRH
jgi:hypothetical protein